MHRVARYRSMVHAEQAAMALQDAGIDARVVGHHVHDFNLSLLSPTYEVMIASKDDLGPAKAFLEDWGERPTEGVAIDMDDDAWVPDLTLLDPDAFGVDCPRCTMPLPMDASAKRCPSCEADVDVVERILEVHGPEALMHAEPDEEHTPAAHEPGTIAWDERCATCRASLRGQPLSGRCPACGSLYAVDQR